MTTLNNLPHKKDERKTLRNNLTPAEAKLWSQLKNGQLNGFKFRRQHSINEFILDFYCPEKKLVVELDGAGHFTSAGNLHDATRTELLAQHGIHVLRFENKLIWSDLASVLHAIDLALAESK
ncbi:endonuclease domain-containing protein [Hymenobacter saemangeumensis]|uniref:Endonuclease domain-containing protein n=1 Tax=Hymenobacter saemangeumensis TaxID=1084522 RepID=A0ABP8IT47_9BACT